MNMEHPLVKYGLAVVLFNQYDGKMLAHLPSDEAIILELQKGLDHFRLKPQDDIQTNKTIRYKYINQRKADGGNFVYLAPNIIVEDKPAGNTYSAIEKVLKEMKNKPDGVLNFTKSISPMAGDYLVFGPTNASKGTGKITTREAAFSLICSTTLDKPCLAYKKLEKSKIKRTNVGIIPDLPLDELVQFVCLISHLKDYSTKGRLSLLKGKVIVEKDKKGTEKSRFPLRPTIYDGNFPYAPSVSALSKFGLLASITELIKETKYHRENTNWVAIEKMTKSFSKCTFYLFQYGDAATFTYDHFIIDLAFRGNLYSIVNGLFRSRLFHFPQRNNDTRIEYSKYDFFAGRFLQLFNDSAFRDFFAFRCEYKSEVLPLFKTFFMNKKKIDSHLVDSAWALGTWINTQAYWLATADKQSTDTVYERKAKILATIESGIMSAKTGSDIAVRAIRDISQHSKKDAPAESEAFLKATATGQLDKQTAKNLLIAFSRISSFSKNNEKQGANDRDNTEGEFALTTED